MKHIFPTLFLVSLLIGCSNPTETLKQRAIRDYPTFWEKPEQIALIRREQNIPEEYKFQRLEFTGGTWDKEAHYGLFGWSFRFAKKPSDYIEVRHICYYDLDSVVPFDVKQVRIHWLDFKIAKRSFQFRGDEEKLNSQDQFKAKTGSVDEQKATNTFR